MIVTQSCPTLYDLWTVAHQASLSMGSSRQEHWSGLPCLYPRDFPNRGSNPGLLHCRQILYRLSYREASPCDLRQLTNPLCVCFLTCKTGLIVEGELQGCQRINGLFYAECLVLGLTPHKGTMCVSLLLLVVVGMEVSPGITAIAINTTPAIQRWSADRIRQLFGST